jgi:hypothetical protein
MTVEQAIQPKAKTESDTSTKEKSLPKLKSIKTKKPKLKIVKGRRRGRKPYPVIPFEQALRIGQGIADFGAGHPMRRTTLLEKLTLPVNQPTKDLITASGKYGLTEGAHDAEELS